VTQFTKEPKGWACGLQAPTTIYFNLLTLKFLAMNFLDLDFDLNFGNFNPEDIDTDETINAVFIVDTSPSVQSYVKDLNTAFNDFTSTLQKSHIAKRLFVSVLEFNSNIHVANGFQPISNIPVMDFSKRIKGATALYDAIITGLKNALDYRNNLENSGIDTKTLIFVLTDGWDNASKHNAHEIKLVLDDLRKDERSAFSFSSILFGIGMDSNFGQIQKNLGFDHWAKVGTSGKELRKMIGFISQSISSVSAGGGFPAPIDF
jgi:uncharacterized protein YegL